MIDKILEFAVRQRVLVLMGPGTVGRQRSGGFKGSNG